MLGHVPRLWTETIESHRQAVRDAVLDAAASLLAAKGVRGLTMSDVAEAAGVGRATLYKYFADVGSILVAWHEREVGRHLAELTAVRERPGRPLDRLAAVLETYAELAHRARPTHGSHAAHGPHGLHGPHGPQGGLTTLLHGTEGVAIAHERVGALVRALVEEGVASGDVRSDVPPVELARFCLHAIGAAGEARSRPAVRRLMTTIVDALRA